MSKVVKQMMFDSLRRIMASHSDFIVVDVSRVPGSIINRLRLDLAENQVQIFGVKNAIAAKVFSDAGIKLVGESFLGACSIAFGDVDSVVLSKEMIKCVQANKLLSIRGGIIDGRVVSAGDVDGLSKSPGRLELLGQLAGLINSPSSTLIRSFGSPAAALASQVGAVGAYRSNASKDGCFSE